MPWIGSGARTAARAAVPAGARRSTPITKCAGAGYVSSLRPWDYWLSSAEDHYTTGAGLVHRRCCTTASTISAGMPQVSALRSEMLGLGSGNTPLWELVEYNSQFFNPHRMAPILSQFLEEPLWEVRADPRLTAYLRQANKSARIYENVKDLTAKDLATAITAAREVGHVEAEDLSDALVETVSAELQSLSALRISFFITAFAKQRVVDARFWRAAASAISRTTEPFSPQVLVSLFDAFRKSGLRSEKLYRTLAHRVYGVLDDLGPTHIPPIVATVCRVPLAAEDRDRVTRILLGRWLGMLKQERAQPTGVITVQQILSLSVSLALVPEEINTAVFARDVSAFIDNNFDILGAEDLIVFLWSTQRLVPVGGLPSFFVRGLRQVAKLWPELQTNAQLSVQRLTQLSDVLVERRHDGSWESDMEVLQGYVIKDLSECIQYCQPDGLAELLEIWLGNKKFWLHYPDFTGAILKRMEELFLESGSIADLLPILQAVKGVPGLYASLDDFAIHVLRAAILSRGAADAERIRSVLAGSEWEPLCGEAGLSIAAVASSPAISVELERASRLEDSQRPSADEALIASYKAVTGAAFPLHLESQGRPSENLVSFLKAAHENSRGAREALLALEAAAPLAPLLMTGVGEVYMLLEQLGDKIAASIQALSPQRNVAAMRACAIAGLPHAFLFGAGLVHLNGTHSPLLLIEAFEACALLRLSIPEIESLLVRLKGDDVERRLPAPMLARFFAAGSRLKLWDADGAHELLRRIITVSSQVRPPRLEMLFTLCYGLYLSRWKPRGFELWQIASWLGAIDVTSGSPPQVTALQSFGLSVLADSEGRDAVGRLDPALQRAFASAVGGDAVVRRAPVSDTTLKFRYEVAEVLRSGGHSYDLDLSLAPGVTADLTILGPSGIVWLLDGPEAFLRPFQMANGELNLIPAEQRRAELMDKLLLDKTAADMEETLMRWSTAADNDPISKPGRRFGRRDMVVNVGSVMRMS